MVLKISVLKFLSFTKRQSNIEASFLEVDLFWLNQSHILETYKQAKGW